MKRLSLPAFLAVALVALLAVASACGRDWEEQQADGYKLIVQKNGPTLGYTSVPILNIQGRAFSQG